MLIVGVVTLLIVGPKDLPKVIKTVRDGMKQVRGLAREFQSGVDDLANEADLDDTKKILKNVSSGSIEKSIRETVDPKGELEKDLNEIAQEGEYQKASFMASSETKKAAEPAKADDDSKAKKGGKAEAKPKSKAKSSAKPKTASAKTSAPKKAAVKKETAKKAPAKAKTSTAKAAPKKTTKPASKPTKKS